MEVNAITVGGIHVAKHPLHIYSARFSPNRGGVKTMTDEVLNEAKQVLKAEVRQMQITIGEHTVTVAELINVTVGLDCDMAFGTEYLNRFDIMEMPSPREVYDWLSETEYALMIDTEEVKKLLGFLGRLQFEVSVARIRAKAESMGFAVMEIEV